MLNVHLRDGLIHLHGPFYLHRALSLPCGPLHLYWAIHYHEALVPIVGGSGVVCMRRLLMSATQPSELD